MNVLYRGLRVAASYCADEYVAVCIVLGGANIGGECRVSGAILTSSLEE